MCKFNWIEIYRNCYHFVCDILSVPFCPIPFCPVTVNSAIFYVTDSVRYFEESHLATLGTLWIFEYNTRDLGNDLSLNTCILLRFSLMRGLNLYLLHLKTCRICHQMLEGVLLTGVLPRTPLENLQCSPQKLFLRGLCTCLLFLIWPLLMCHQQSIFVLVVQQK